MITFSLSMKPSGAVRPLVDEDVRAHPLVRCGIASVPSVMLRGRCLTAPSGQGYHQPW